MGTWTAPTSVTPCLTWWTPMTSRSQTRPARTSVNTEECLTLHTLHILQSHTHTFSKRNPHTLHTTQNPHSLHTTHTFSKHSPLVSHKTTLDSIHFSGWKR